MIPEIEITALVPDQIVRLEIVNALEAKLHVRDTFNGATTEIVLNTQEAAATLYLMVVGNDGEFSSEMHDMVTGVFVDTPNALRPIP
tara:strand:+ start:1051 stop:1311 length:261 start_codon:yes stop_codon:yes gene_type:complete